MSLHHTPDAPNDVEPCPICHRAGLVGETLDGFWSAMCSDDNCIVIASYFPDRDAALRVWNRRGPAFPAQSLPDSAKIGVAA